MALGMLKAGIGSVLLVLVAFKAGQYSSDHADRPLDRAPSVDDLACRPFLPNLHSTDPPSADHPLLRNAAADLNEFLESTFKETGLDGLSAAVVTASGIVFQGNWGLQRVNGTEERKKSPPIDANSMYRVASVSKMFIAYEGWILAQRGIINWQDPVSKYLPSFVPNDTSLATGHSFYPSITLHDLSSHLSGLGRDWPPGQQASKFPEDLGGNGPPPENGLPFPTGETVLASIRKHTLVHPPGYRPSYSNTGPGILGMALVAADKLARGGKPGPETVSELMTRDIFHPLGLTGSTYKPNQTQLKRVVVPEIEPEMVDLDFGNAMNPSGGQFSTLNDLAVVLRSLIDPPRNLKGITARSALTPESVAHWLKPVHAYEEDDWSESGAPWEIVKHLDSWGRRRRVYFKLGNLPAHHTAFAVKPGSGYGVLILQSGTGAVAPAAMAYKAFDIFQPAFDRALAQRVEELYAGTWRNISDWDTDDYVAGKQRPMHPHSGSGARIVVRNGTIYVENLRLLGQEVLQHLWGAQTGNGHGVPLQSTGRPDEFRLDVAAAVPGTQTRHMACMASWAFLDDWGMKNDAGHNMLYFTGGPGTDAPRQLHYPAAGVIMQRL